MSNKIIHYGVAGIHGFSRTHIQAILSLVEAGEPVSLTAVSAYQREKDEAYAASLESQGVEIVDSFDELLDRVSDLDIITVPTGIHLHVPMAIEVLKRDRPVLIEKPVTGAIEDALKLEQVAAECEQTVFVGYQHCYMPSTWRLKEMLCRKRLGNLRKINIMAAWPRNTSYYGRNDWAGKLKKGDTFVFDSPANNACAHYLNLPLFLAGSDVLKSAIPSAVEAELYRANPITSVDTTCIRVKSEEGVEIVFNASHACADRVGPLCRIECDRGIITQDLSAVDSPGWRVFEKNTEIDLVPRDPSTFTLFQPLTEYLLGKSDAHVYTLEQAKQQTVAINGAFSAAPIVDVAASETAVVDHAEGKLVYAKNMNQVLEDCFQHGCLPSELGNVSWAREKHRVENVKDLRSARI